MPVHKVEFTKPFAIARYETTFDEYDRFARATGRKLPKDEDWGRGQRPVINVSWDDAKAYAQWLSQQTGSRYRLPTEAEWEYAARSGRKNTLWAGTSDESQLDTYAVYSKIIKLTKEEEEINIQEGEDLFYPHPDTKEQKNYTEPVGSRKPNEFGLYDMTGNVWEWVEDCEHTTYDGAPRDGSAWLGADGGDCVDHVIRGGSWKDNQDESHASARRSTHAVDRSNSVGFRLVQDIP